MASTSLSEQLKNLSAPQTSIFKDSTKKASLLFDPKEAASKERDTFYEIGISGLRELITLDECFRVYEHNLFSISSKDFERAVQSKEVNLTLDKTLEKFLYQLSPYLLLQSSHKALEWLVNRYHIHQYNQDALFGLILPYYETKIFVRILQLMNLKSSSNRWNWLEPLQKPGVHLPKQVLYSHCASSKSTLLFIARSVLKYIKYYGEKASQLNTVFAFFCSVSIGTLNVTKVTESVISALLPVLIKALDSPINEFRSSAYIVLGYLVSRCSLKEITLNEVIDKLLNSQFDMTYDMVLLTNLIYSTQNHLPNVSHSVLCNLSVDTMTTLCDHLKRLVEQKINVQSFVLKFLAGVMPSLQENMEQFHIFSKLPEVLIEVVNFKTQNPEKIIKCVMDLYISTPKEAEDGNESDIEIIDDDSSEKDICRWYSGFLKNLESKYPNAFEKVFLEEMKHNKKGSNVVANLMTFKPHLSHRVGDITLFENLNSVHPQRRAKGVYYIARNFDVLKKENEEFVRLSLMNRMYDENFSVVDAVLTIPTEMLSQVFKEDDLVNIFTKVINRDMRDFKKWRPIISGAVRKFCAMDNLPVTQEVILAMMPHLLPYDEDTTAIAHAIVDSSWGQRFSLTKQIKTQNPTSDVANSKSFCTAILTALTSEEQDFNSLLNITDITSYKTSDVCMYLLLKLLSFKKPDVDELTNILNVLLCLVENKEITAYSENHTFGSQHLSTLVEFSRQDTILFEFMQHIFSEIINKLSEIDIAKPWCNIFQSKGTILIRKLIEIFLTGSFNQTYKDDYAILLQKLLGTLFLDSKEKVEFFANIACGHILYAPDPKDVISPELQLRCLLLIDSFIKNAKNTDFVFKSDVIIVMILLNLYNPLSVIREMTIKLVKSILALKVDENNILYQLMGELHEHKLELIIDHEQICVVLETILTQQNPKTKVFRKNCLNHLLGVLNGSTPAHVASEFLKVVSKLNNSKVYSHIAPLMGIIFESLKEKTDSRPSLNIYESKMLCNIVERIDKVTVMTFNDDKIWQTIACALKEYRPCVLNEQQLLISPAVLVMTQIDEQLFKHIPEKRTKSLIDLICRAGAFSNNPNISSVAAKTMKKIFITYDQFKGIFDSMLNVQDPNLSTRKKSKSQTLSMLSYSLIETEEWRCGIAMLEYVQSKKKMSVNNNYVTMLFKILNKCLRFEEQSYVEYTKQLILSSLWYYCKKFVDESDKEQAKSLKSVFDIELVVQCIRGTQNPQTHHHSLILLSHAAYLLPDQVLHHTMEIFTFMGTSVLRHDDAYSFQIITKILETLIPILVKLDKQPEEYTERELKILQKRVVPVLRIFADAVLHVPEHRRLPLYTKLIETLGPNQFLWVFLALLLETHVTHFNENKDKEKKTSRSLADQEAPVTRLDFGQNILTEFSPDVAMENLHKLILYIKSLPLQKPDNSMDVDVDPTDIFSVNGHTALQLRHYRYVIITFLNTCLSSSRFITHVNQADDIVAMESQYKTFIINILTFIQSITKINDEKTAKYWRIMLHHSYEVLDHTNNLLSVNMFLSVVRGLMKYTMQTVRRKSMELLNSKIQFSQEFFADCDKELLYSLLPILLDIVKTIDSDSAPLPSDTTAQELELNQQTALLTLKLLTRMLATENPEAFKPVLEIITEYTCNLNLPGNVMASVVLCLAELCANLKAHALASLRKFMPALIKVLKSQREIETPELILLSTVTAVAKIVESVPLFLSPYLQKILYEYSILLAKWEGFDQECAKVSAVVAKLVNIRKKIAGSIPPRVLIPVVSQTYQSLLEREHYESIGPLMLVLANSFANVTAADFKTLQQDLTSFFLAALQLRSDATKVDVDIGVISKAEDEVVNAMVALVLKLSESNFRPFYFKMYDWAIRSNVEMEKDRVITFYRLSNAIAEKLKGLFVLFAGHFIKNSAELLDACNDSKTESLYFDSDDKCIILVNYILKTLYTVFLYDSQSFINKDRFEALMQAIVDQLENTVGGINSYKARAEEVVIPCISQFAVATADDSLWKLLNYQILLKTRHNDPEIRLTALDCLIKTASQLGTNWLPLLAESVPFLAELLEDGDQKIENETKEAIRNLEQILGEPLEKYF